MSRGESTPPPQLFGLRRVVPDESEDDRAVVRRVRSGDVESFGILVRRYEKPVFQAVRRIVRDREEARDVAQTAFVKAYRELASFDETYRFFSWLYRIAIHEALNHVRGGGRVEPMVGDRPTDDPGPVERLEAAETGRLVEEAVSHLTREHRAVILLRHFGECSYQEIAQTLGVSEKTVRSRLFEARKTLRSILGAMGVVP